mmetsp:Transcript_102536/g.258317  ORF Transcript_102536/g.258317 Transcript_102536/m.258317 type:complete len:1585 (-) Transcript_102536:49-4803(-)
MPWSSIAGATPLNAARGSPPNVSPPRDAAALEAREAAALATREARRERVEQVCRELGAALGFQSDSIRNQAEHVEALWESFLARHGGNPVSALRDLAAQLLRTQRDWFEKVWQPLTSEVWQDAPLKDVCLYLLIWGELGNLRFCPEFACYLFAAARSSSRQNRTEVGGNLFVRRVVRPVFEVVLSETFTPGDPPKFKYGKAPAPANACNYDDWNELFWDPLRLKRCLVMKDRGANAYISRPKRLHDICQGRPWDIWGGLGEVDWERTLRNRKSHREPHTILPLLVGCYRIFLLHTFCFVTLLLAWYSDPTYGEWPQRCALGLVAPCWMWIYSVGFQALTPALAWRNRFKKLLKLVFLDSLPFASYALVLSTYYGWYELPSVDIIILGDTWTLNPSFECQLVLHFFLSTMVLLLALAPRAQNLYRWKFFPSLSECRSPATAAFWLCTVALKIGIDVFGVKHLDQALGNAAALHAGRGASWTRFSLFAVHSFLLVAPAALVCFASLPLASNVVVSFVGAARGIRVLGGWKLFWYRRGIGLTRTPPSTCERVLQLPRGERPARETLPAEGRRGLGAMQWWSRMSDRELKAFVSIWNVMIYELREKDLLSDQEMQQLTIESAEAARRGPPNVPRLLDPMNVFRLTSVLPQNKEARRRVVTFARSLQMQPLPAATVRTMPGLTVLIPHYSETILFSMNELFTNMGSAELLRYLVSYYCDEFSNFKERVCDAMGMNEDQDEEALGRFDGFQKFEDPLCKWASLRMQTLWRTVEGVCRAYARALLNLSEQQDQALSRTEREALVSSKFQVVVAMQRYALFADPTKSTYDIAQIAAVEAMLQAFGQWLSIAYIDEEQTPEGKRYYSCLIDASCPMRPGAMTPHRSWGQQGGGMRVPKFSIELPGYPILGHGKSDNQNCAVVFTRGEILQMIDANQEAYFESALFLPLALKEFESTRGGRRPGILGFREHIFSAVGSLGRLAADSEFAFGTLIQRTMDWPLDARLHYGHPDMMDKLQMLQQGGVSKATRGLNLSEDVFAGMDLTLRGGWTAYREYFHVGKGRDMGFMSVLSFFGKVSMGNGEQALTRQWMRFGLSLPLARLLGIFYMHVGFFLNQCLVNWSTKAFAFTVAFFSLTSRQDPDFKFPAAILASNYFGILYLAFVLSSMWPLLFEVYVEHGLIASLRSLGSSFLALSPVFSTFQGKLMAFYFESTVNYGGAQYIPTGRGLATSREPLSKLFQCFSNSHFHDGLEVAVLLCLGTEVKCGVAFYICMGLTVFSWMCAPFIFNPHQFDDLSVSLQDVRLWARWICATEGGEETSWEAWSIRQQEVKQGSSLVWLFLPSSRWLAVICTGTLLIQKDFDWASLEAYFSLFPPLAHAALCALLAFLRHFCWPSLPLCRPLARLALAAAALTAAEAVGTTRAADDVLCVTLHKYMCVRLSLDLCDWIVAHRPGGCALAVLHDACRLWALSLRLVRDVALGLLLSSFCVAVALIPGISRLHVLFLFRALPRQETRIEGCAREASVSTDRLGESFYPDGTARGSQRLLADFLQPTAQPARDQRSLLHRISTVGSLVSSATDSQRGQEASCSRGAV